MASDQKIPRRSRVTQKAKRSAATRSRLLNAARRLFQEHGYHEVTVTEIARAAGVTHAMINNHFYSKAGLLYELINENNGAQISDLEERLPKEGSMIDRLRWIVTMYAEHDLADPQLMAVMQAYYWQWPRETEARNRSQLLQALTPVTNVLRCDPELGKLKQAELESLVEAMYSIYILGLRPAVYRDETLEACVEAIMFRVGLIVEGARTLAQRRGMGEDAVEVS